MASSYTWTTADQTTAPALNETPPHSHQAQTSLLDQGQPPSPNDLSAAAILATLSDSRPPTNQGEDEEELDDDQAGGISLEHDVHSFGAPLSHAMSAPAAVSFGSINEVVLPSGELASHELATYDPPDQHAAALEAFTMEHLPSVASFAPIYLYPLYMQEQIQAFAPNAFHEQELETAPYDEHLSVQNKETFMDVSSFFYHFAATRAASLGLDVADVPEAITREDLQGDKCDFQGIDWSLRYTTRESMRLKRVTFESARMQPKVREIRQRRTSTANTDNHFSFRRMNTTHKAIVPHFQLRNLLATPSRNDIYYASRSQIMHTDASGSPATVAMDLSKHITEAQSFSATTLAGARDILICGGFEGEYAIRNLSSTHGAPHFYDRIKDRYADSKSHITNHIHLFDSRTTYTPQAAFCSNDYRLRILDVATNTFTRSSLYPTAVNCSATSPNGRMRVVVGDFQETLITNAETGKPFETLKSHADDVFACAWADDGVHVATAAQDSTIVVWDARNWGNPLAVLYSELSIPRTLRFSPVGSGPRVLIAGEADDYISIINAQTFESKQVFDFFGQTAGISMTPDGHSLFVANSDKRFGGIIELERAGWFERAGGSMTDWEFESDMNHNQRVVCGWNERDRRGMDLGDLAV